MTPLALTPFRRRMLALAAAVQALAMIGWTALLAGLAIYVVASPVTLTVVLVRMLWQGCR